MKKGLIQNLLFIFIISTSLTLTSCNNSSKKITVSENTEGEVTLEESEIIKAITTGEKLLDENKLEEAKEFFNKAVSLEKENKDTYIRIKDKYISINKLDEAYIVIKTAISNNVDIENMKSTLKEISSKFEVVKISSSIYQNGSYVLPKEVTTNISDTPLSIPVTWNNENIDTNNVGTFTYEGYNNDYGRKVIVELTVMENIYDKQVGCIKNIYSANGKTYIDVDLVEFYSGAENAKREALKDRANRPLPYEEDGDEYLPSSFYLRNNYNTITTYELSNDCSIQMLDYDFEPLGYSYSEINSTNMISTLKDFKNYIIFRKKANENKLDVDANAVITDLSTLCSFEIKNGIVTSIYRQEL